MPSDRITTVDCSNIEPDFGNTNVKNSFSYVKGFG